MTLTPTQAKILAAIETAAPDPIRYGKICQYVYGYEYMPRRDRALLHPHITNLRRKLGRNSITTVRGVGYQVGKDWTAHGREMARTS